jgi:hypothetical protein
MEEGLTVVCHQNDAGIVVDTVSVSAWAQKLSLSLGVTTEQIGMKTGMLLSAIFPMIGVVLLLFIKRYFRKENV